MTGSIREGLLQGGNGANYINSKEVEGIGAGINRASDRAVEMGQQARRIGGDLHKQGVEAFNKFVDNIDGKVGNN